MIDTNDGRKETFKAGDTVLVPRGTSYIWDQWWQGAQILGGV